jgi:DNA-binding winged helix-turn-helix (wHTH) protein
LLEHSGELVTREELQRKLWPADTFVDFDTSLNSAIKKLRDALADSAEEPRYIETVPRRGYRFIAHVEGTPKPALARKAGPRRTK